MKSVMLFLINGEHQHHRNIILDQLILALSVSVLINNKNFKKKERKLIMSTFYYDILTLGK